VPVLGVATLFAFLVLCLLLYWGATYSLFARVLQLHGIVLALHRLHPGARYLTYVPLKVLTLSARYALWWIGLRRALTRRRP
jgi:hypothetical protein